MKMIRFHGLQHSNYFMVIVFVTMKFTGKAGGLLTCAISVSTLRRVRVTLWPSALARPFYSVLNQATISPAQLFDTLEERLRPLSVVTSSVSQGMTSYIVTSSYSIGWQLVIKIRTKCSSMQS